MEHDQVADGERQSNNQSEIFADAPWDSGSKLRGQEHQRSSNPRCTHRTHRIPEQHRRAIRRDNQKSNYQENSDSFLTRSMV
ncbi:hypothetical protein M7I_0387 [Glarea lozoyensis 74030]|uniref:Uncharacterized protein n=1 Tax=Glarea lozoyensis (strain ATCC 74030 / MF5533) TaxID=1104152 RepID=H0ED84_GLAL7|nr:hypothetical protein M7I_0387 [Glarea lozoyensis 74030]